MSWQNVMVRDDACRLLLGRSQRLEHVAGSIVGVRVLRFTVGRSFGKTQYERSTSLSQTYNKPNPLATHPPRLNADSTHPPRLNADSTHPPRLDADSNLGNALRAHGLYTEAAEIQRAIVAALIAIVGNDHITIFQANGNLAATLYDQGQSSHGLCIRYALIKLSQGDWTWRGSARAAGC
jgi:hypothetical protein